MRQAEPECALWIKADLGRRLNPSKRSLDERGDIRGVVYPRISLRACARAPRLATAKLGNFVETKAATLEAGAKVNDLSYAGDAHVGANSNLGAGTITCNYDGFSKHKTLIGEGAFVGTNGPANKTCLSFGGTMIQIKMGARQPPKEFAQ